MSLWCKLWNFFLGIFEASVHAIASALDTIGTVALGLAGDLIDAVGKASGSLLGSPVVLIGLGLAAYLLLSKKKDGAATTVVKTVGGVST